MRSLTTSISPPTFQYQRMISPSKRPAILLKKIAKYSIPVWMLLLSLNCKAGLIACSTIQPDTIPSERISLDSVKKLVPLGYYILNEQGALSSIKARIDRDSYKAQWVTTADALSLKTGENFKLTLERNIAQDQNKQDAETIKLLKRKLFWANFKTYGVLAGTAILTVKLISKL
jgi:hypothetical protein